MEGVEIRRAVVIRHAVEDDVPALQALIEASVRGLQANDYTPAQIEGALGHALGLDTQLIEDATFFVAEATAEALARSRGNQRRRRVCACTAWRLSTRMASTWKLSNQACTVSRAGVWNDSWP